MPNRIFNFSAGPAALPEEGLEQARDEMLDYRGTGMSVIDFVDYQGAGMSLIEMSHRGKHYDDVHYEAMAGIREVLNVPDSHDILFIQGGATLQFAMVPLNLMTGGQGRRVYQYRDLGQKSDCRCRNARTEAHHLDR